MFGAVRVIFQLLAQAGNAYPKDLLVGAILRPPDAGQKFFRCHDLADVMGELQQ